MNCSIATSLAEAERLDALDGFDHLDEPVTMVRRHAIEAFQSMTMLEPALPEEG
jgi:hypothetical protein